MSGGVDHKFLERIQNDIAHIRDTAALADLEAAISEPRFTALYQELQVRIYSQLITQLMAESAYDHAWPYVEKLATITHRSDIRVQELIAIYSVMRELGKISAIPLDSPSASTDIAARSSKLLADINSHKSTGLTTDFHQAAGVLCYNFAVAYGLKDTVKARSVKCLEAAIAVLDQPIDRIVRSRAKCGVAILRGLAGDDYLSELTEDERALPAVQAERKKWEGIAGLHK